LVTTLEDRAAAEGRAARARVALGSSSLETTAVAYENAYRRAIAINASRRGRPAAQSLPS
jgi:hypothetical protein